MIHRKNYCHQFEQDLIRLTLHSCPVFGKYQGIQIQIKRLITRFGNTPGNLDIYCFVDSPLWRGTWFQTYLLRWVLNVSCWCASCDTKGSIYLLNPSFYLIYLSPPNTLSHSYFLLYFAVCYHQHSTFQ